MADTKISALPASTTPLAGTEVLPIVQSSVTKQVSVANLTAGRAVATGALTVTGAISATSGYNGTVGATTANTGAFTTLTASGLSTFSTSIRAVGMTDTALTGSPNQANFMLVSSGDYMGMRSSTAHDLIIESFVKSEALKIAYVTGLVTFGYGAAVTGALSATGTLSGGTSGTAYSFSGSAPAASMALDSSGNLLVIGAGGLGYGTGSGGAVTQATSRTTGVTLNKTNGAITLVSSAGLATFQSFTVTNSTVAATDVVHVTQKSGTDLYQIFVTATAAGSFRISFATTGGVTTEQPVFNFAVIKAVAA
jgi:hypothetical protein